MPGMNQGDNLEEIYTWINEIPFSRPKRNIPRDFSDGVLMAEVLKLYYPRYVDAHNYVPASNVAAKKENWITLNRKVFSKIDMKLSKDVVNQLANAQPGVIQKVLIDLRNKILIKGSSTSEHNPLNIEYDENLNEEKTANDEPVNNDNPKNYIIQHTILTTVISQKDENINEGSRSSGVPNNVIAEISSSDLCVTKSGKNLIGKACGWIADWIWPFNRSSKSAEVELSSSSISEDLKPLEKTENSTENSSEYLNSVELVKTAENDDDQEASISRLDFLRLREEVWEKNVAISVLNRKVSCLESVMKSKDKKIGNLAARISASSDAAQNLRPHVMGSSISRLRSSRSKNRH